MVLTILTGNVSGGGVVEAQVWMTGRVGGEVEYRVINSNLAFANFPMACTPRIQRGGVWEDAETTWVSVSCARGLAEHVKCSVAKGDPVVVVGRLRTRRWVDADGGEHERLSVEASVVGHDLCLGTTRFTRVRRPSQPGEGEADVPGEANEGQDVDAAGPRLAGVSPG